MSHGSLVDPSFELLDPTPDIHALFMQFDERFFGSSLAMCEVKWSPRMYSCAGICSYEVRGGRGGLCSIRLSKPLLTLRPRKDLVETLLHEMIHAYLFVKERNRDRDGHGPQFQAHMHRINRSGGTNITIYHSFHDEVRLFKQHWWRCTGSCKNRRPFFGYVKRSSNRAPGPNDRWWSQHLATCGGSFEKVKEPEGYGQKKKTASTNSNQQKAPAKKVGGQPKKTLDDFFKKPNTPSPKKPTPSSSPVKSFSGSGQKLGGTSTSSNLLDKYPVSRPIDNRSIRIFNPPSSIPSTSAAPPEVIYLDDSDDDDVKISRHTSEVVIPDDDDDDVLELSFVLSATTVICPSCNDEVQETSIHDHLDYCLA